ncbi:ATP-binding protein [Leptospira wolffii]|uniref:ATP-binding protein n=1 Tax=Leptospira wolffii TaxID=409998 RepID=UPI0010834E68|nr:ATP-binding protein [Leptospira wolffii]TGL55258.1 ATP-binding protein [Leptospira wolffii]
MKQQIDTQDATPGKALYRSIIADYDTETSLCELIDNAIDVWTIKGKNFNLIINIIIDIQRQVIRVTDNAGGIQKDNLHFVIGPGHSSNESSANIIGIFGVGSKRSVIALSPQITIKSKYKKQPTYTIEITDEWLKTDDWRFPIFQDGEIEPNSTEIEMVKIRKVLNKDSLWLIRNHLSDVYGKLLDDKKIQIFLNGDLLKGTKFDESWSYNDIVPPKGYAIEVNLNGRIVNVKFTGGITCEGGDSGWGDFGVYVYCNERLIVKRMKTYDVGFGKGQAGEPHNYMSLTRVIVEINGPADLMPWNSSKNGIDTKHEVFNLLRPQLVDLVKHYTAGSKSLFPERKEKVFIFSKGKVKYEALDSISQIDTSLLPVIPKIKKSIFHKIKQANQALADSDPWIVGTYESVAIAESIKTKNFETKNRVILILLDSSIEIAFKDYLTNKISEFYNDAKLTDIFEKRHKVHDAVKKHSGTSLDATDWTNLNYFYRLRCDLVHRRTTANVTDSDIAKFTKLTKKVHKKLLGIKYPT